MSFILEALKRSENERQRQTGPGLATAPTGERVKRRPPWLAIAVGLLVLNLAVLAFLLTRPPTTPSTAAPAASPRPSATPSPAAAADMGREDRAASAPRVASTHTRGATPAPALRGSAAPARNDAPTTTLAPPAATAAPRPAPSPGGEAPPRREVRSLSAEVAAPPVVQPPVAGPIAEAEPPPAPAQTPEPAAAPTPAPASTPVSRGLPTVAEMTLKGEFSGRPLHLDLHVYYDDPARRLVFINGSKYKEGERLEDGLTVDEIVPEGVVLDDGRQRFLLPST